MKKTKMQLRKLFMIGFFIIQNLICFSASSERFLHFTKIDGLPRNIITSIAQDQYGYIWIGTNNGVARYNGKDFKHYEESSGNEITQLLYDSENTLWAGTKNGLFKYNPISNHFELVVNGYIAKLTEDNGIVYFLMMSNIFKIENNEPVLVYQGKNISDFCFSEEGLWVSRSDDGLSLLDRNDNFETVKSSFLKNLTVAQIRIIDNLLLADLYNGDLYTISENRHVKEIEVNNHYFYKTFKKIGDEIWAATDGNGIIVFDKNLKFLRKIDRNSNNAISINSNSIYDILLGRNNEIWIATYGAGLTCILPDNQLFRNILPEKGNNNSLVANEGVSVFANESKIYFGTNYGLSEWNINNQQFKNLPGNQLQKEINGTKVTAINVDMDNAVWVGTYDGLLGKYSSNLSLERTYHPCSKHPNEMQQIVGIKEVSKNNLVILTQFHSKILLNFNKNTGTSNVFELYHKGSNVTYCLLNSLRSNQQGELLAVISNSGLYHVNWKENVIENRLKELNAELKSTITDFYHDQEGNYWITTSTDGLTCISSDGSVKKRWTEKDGLPSNTLVRIESTDDRFLWISTISGICRFDTKTNEILNFNHRDGLPANEFHDRVSATLSDDRIVFGSLAGFTLIDPSKVSTDTIPAEVVISDITFQNQSIRSPHGTQYLTKALEETEKIKLPYNKNSFTIHFFAKNKSFSKYHNYKYRLVGFEENWSYQGETNYATYTNLSPGSYTFEIKSADKSQPGKTTTINVIIKAPWYLSLYAYIFYIILFFTILYLSIYAILKRFELLKQKEVSDFKLQKEHELTEKKIEFFTNISHDLKTPLTLISGPINDLLQSKNLNQEQLNKLLIVNRNSKRLFKLITDLLDFRKINQNQFNLEIKETNISSLINDCHEAFIEECRNKSVKLSFISTNESLIGYVDAEKIKKILWNLMSNALKFTRSEGEIAINLEVFKENNIRKIKLKIKDNGIGISKEDTNKIFERFYKGNGPDEKNKEGTGIGLSIVKELVITHRGQIHVDSIPDQGSTFCVSIPIDKEAYDENDILIIDQQHEINNSIVSGDINHLQYNTQRILVVEDNDELREYLTAHFLKKYKVVAAADGFEGLKIVREKDIDIILTDVQMPKMNGYDFCEALRSNFDTSHLPIIMLTANNTIEQQLEGLSTGADIYLTKPFDIRLLDAHIVSLLERRDKLRKKFNGIETSEKLQKTLPQKDVDFIIELKKLIEENMMNHELNVDYLSVHFSVSLAQIHRKVKSLMGTTPNNLIKSIRLKKAYKLISEEGCRVSEAAYQTGFSDPNYFTTCFRKEFGETPSQVALNTKKMINTF